jgi:hypothetical protein
LCNLFPIDVALIRWNVDAQRIRRFSCLHCSHPSLVAHSSCYFQGRLTPYVGCLHSVHPNRWFFQDARLRGHYSGCTHSRWKVDSAHCGNTSSKYREIRIDRQSVSYIVSIADLDATRGTRNKASTSETWGILIG